jgi:hypothetical protein
MVWFLTEAREEFEADMKQGFTVEADGGGDCLFCAAGAGGGSGKAWRTRLLLIPPGFSGSQEDQVCLLSQTPTDEISADFKCFLVVTPHLSVLIYFLSS